jgi:DNA gyrase subunit B
MSNTYNTDSIQSLGILGGVRAKPASIGLESHSHTFIEILMNAIDEYREGYGKQIIVTKYKDNSISIQDFGRSLPMAKNSQGEYAYKKIFEEMWSGGKYENNSKTKNGNYKWSCGTNGMGNFGSSATADFLEATAFAPNNIKYHVRYEKGIQVGEFEETTHNFDSTGTIIHWIPSKEVFKGDNDITKEFIIDILQQQAIINDDLKFTYKDENTDEELVFYYENGTIDYIKELDTKQSSLTDIIKWTTEGEGRENKDDEIFVIKSNITFAFNNDINLIQYYHNSSFLENGGTPQDFIKNGFTYAIDKYITEKNLYKNKEKKVTFDDIQDSLVIISDTYSTISLYTDQAKKKIKSKFMQSHVTDFLREKLYIFFTENPLIGSLISNQILINKRVREHGEVAKKNIKKKLEEANKSGRVKIEGLTDCNMKKSALDERFLLVVEGLSAKSTVVDSYDNNTMGAVGLKGRFISCLKTTVDRVLNNVPAFTLISALGCGIEIPYEERKAFKDIKTFDKNNLRYGNIGILTDADCWGSGIRLALLTFIYKYLPTLLKEDRVYIIISPRYEIKMKSGEMIYAYNDREKEELMKTIDTNDIYNIGIVKGIGEINADDFWEKVLCPEVREKTFIQVTYDNFDEIVAKYFEDYMGENTQPRKEFVKEFITNVNLEEIN